MTDDYPLLDSIDTDGTNLFVNLRPEDDQNGELAPEGGRFARINFPGVDERDSIYLSFEHGTEWPALYLYERDQEEPAYVLFLPTSTNGLDEVHTAKDPETWHSQPEELIKRADRQEADNA